jgi:hypothetical protein
MDSTYHLIMSSLKFQVPTKGLWTCKPQSKRTHKLSSNNKTSTVAAAEFARGMVPDTTPSAGAPAPVYHSACELSGGGRGCAGLIIPDCSLRVCLLFGLQVRTLLVGTWNKSDDMMWNP